MKLHALVATLIMALVFAGSLAFALGAQDVRPSDDAGGSIRGRVIGGGDRPVGGVRVVVSGRGVFTETTLTREDGTFEVKVPSTGTYVIRLDAPGYRPARASARIDQPLQVVDPVIRLVPASLRVRVFSTGGNQGLPGVSIVVTAHDGGEPVTGTTDGNGDCYFGAMRAGWYSIKATLVGYEPGTDDVLVASSSEMAMSSIALSKGSSIPVARSRQRYGTPRLPSDEVRQIAQDDRGLMWFATNRGVARFDGADFETSGAQGSELSSLDDVDVRAVAHAAGKLWFGTTDGLMTLGNGSVERVPELNGQAVNAIREDESGSVWIASAGGLFRTGQDGFVRALPGVFTSISVDPLDDSMWFAGGEGGGAVRFAAGALETVGYASPTMLDGHSVTSVHRLGTGDLLLGTTGGAYRVQNGQPSPFLRDLMVGTVTAIVSDSRGNVWFGTDKGALLYDTRRQATSVEFAGERINCLATDREGNLWFATDKGAIRRDLYSFVPIRTSDGLINNSVTWIYPDTAGDGSTQVWFVTSGGVQLYTASATFQEITFPDSEAHVNHIVRDRGGSLWFATSAGVYRLVGAISERMSEAAATWVAETSDGHIYAATKTGVSIFTGTEFVAVADLAGFAPTRLFAIGDDLWLATDDGAVRYVPARRTVESIDVSRGVQGEAVRWVAPDAAGRLWLATDFGVEILDGTTFTKIDGNAGVNAGSDVRTLMFDADGFMWIGSAEGTIRKIAFYEGGVIETAFSADQGIPGSLISAIAEDATGTIWFATDGGASQHRPSRTPPTLLPRIEIDGRAFPAGGTVPAGQHTIRFLFRGITMLGDARYLYRLDDDGPWQQLPPRQESEREVLFTDLAAGEHSFQLRALNRDLFGIEAVPIVLAIRIDVPVWRKWWFWSLLALFGTGLGAGAGVLVRVRSREYVLPPELRTYVPIEPNPFIVGNPIRNEAMFFGREDDFRYVRTKLEGATQGCVVVLCGERRTGKSSILYQILNRRLGDRFIPVFVDLQEMVVANDREFFRRVARLIAEAVHLDRSFVEGFRIDDEALNPYHQFVDFLDDVLARIDDRVLLLLIDEYELLETKADEGRLNPEIFLFLAGLMDNKERLSFVFTGSRRLEERDRRYWREMLRRSQFRKIAFLSENDARRLITEPVAGRVVYGRNVIDRIVRLTAGQPFYTQVICQNVVDFLNENKQNGITMRELDSVVDEIVDHPLPQMIYFWDALSADEKVVLSLVANRLNAPSERSWATAADIVEVVEREKVPVDLSENTIHLTLEELFRTDVLEKNPFEAYRFRIDLLRLWIRRSHSIWEVIKGNQQ